MFLTTLMFIAALLCNGCQGEPRSLPVAYGDDRNKDTPALLTGADQISDLLQLIDGRAVAIVANPTSEIDGVHLVDTLLSLNVNIIRVFGPEHGFRGQAADGEKVSDEVDSKTGLPVVSLYGSQRKPAATQLEGIDVLIFDIQDVGVRFYTYISTLHLVMEAAAEKGVQVIVTDRPNPHIHYIDGPVLKKEFSSFVGMHPVPLVHGMTVGELAQMINGEGWLKGGVQCHLTVLPCQNYTRSLEYELPVPPSPNLPDMTSIYLYPSLGLFEGTEVSVGRGTDYPFRQIGMPGFQAGEHSFTPRSIPGVSAFPPHEGKNCQGFDLRTQTSKPDRINLEWLLTMYRNAPDKGSFFLKNGFFNKLAGTDELMKQIKSGMTEDEIRDTWLTDIELFKNRRRPYLLYE